MSVVSVITKQDVGLLVRSFRRVKDCKDMPTDRGRRLAFLLELSAVQLDVGARDLEQSEAVFAAPGMNWRRSRV